MYVIAAWGALQTVLVIAAVVIVIVLIVLMSTRKPSEEGADFGEAPAEEKGAEEERPGESEETQ